MDLIFSLPGLLSFALLAASLLFFARSVELGALSLPCIMALTSLTYFFVMPAVRLSVGDNGFLGMYFNRDALEWMHWSVLLYAAGAVFAFARGMRTLRLNPAVPRPHDPPLNNAILILLAALAVLGLIAQILAGRLNIEGITSAVEGTEGGFTLRFLNLFFTMMIPLTLIYLVRENFSTRSLIVLGIVSLIILQAAFRYRIVILGLGAVGAFAMLRGFRVHVPYLLGAAVGGIIVLNMIGMARKGRGSGIDLAIVEGMSWSDLFTSFGGEIGIVYVLSYTAQSPLPDFAFLEPWLVGIARLVPTFLWPDKPTAEYLTHFIAGFGVANADKAGIAAPQHVEMLLQFGWWGVLPLAFLYFSIACWLVKQCHRCGREARIAGCAMIPAFFGFYMQTRGYFFQILADGLFLFAPIFLAHAGLGRRRTEAPSQRMSVRGRSSMQVRT